MSSLGSTLAVKLLSATPCDDASRGIYSHRLGDLWLVGGASNVGCAVLREQGFDAEVRTSLLPTTYYLPPTAHHPPITAHRPPPTTHHLPSLTQELTRLSATIDPLSPPTHTDYYPLPAATSGERFPQADEDKVAVLEPVPEDRAEFLHAILHGVARVEAEGCAYTPFTPPYTPYAPYTPHTPYTSHTPASPHTRSHPVHTCTPVHPSHPSHPSHPLHPAPDAYVTCLSPLRYAALASLGASPLRRVLTSGGGANNPQWMEMREALLGVPHPHPHP